MAQTISKRALMLDTNGMPRAVHIYLVYFCVYRIEQTEFQRVERETTEMLFYMPGFKMCIKSCPFGNQRLRKFYLNCVRAAKARSVG